MQDKRDIGNVVQEIMVLVDALSVECVSFGIGHVACSEEDRALIGEDVKKARALLESKLRELEKNSFSACEISVREPLSVDDANKLWDDCIRKYKRPGPYELITEFCNITNTEKDDG